MKMGAQRRLLSAVHQVSPSVCAGAPSDFDKKNVEATGFLLDETRELDMQRINGRDCVDATGFLLDSTFGGLHLEAVTPGQQLAQPQEAMIEPPVVVGAARGAAWEEDNIDDSTQKEQREEVILINQKEEEQNHHSPSGLLMVGAEEEEVGQRRTVSSDTRQNPPDARIYAIGLDFEGAAGERSAKQRSSFEDFLRRSKLEESSLVKFPSGKVQLVSHRELLSGDSAWGQAMVMHTTPAGPAEVQQFLREQQGLGVLAALRLQLLPNGDALLSPARDLQPQTDLPWRFLRVQPGAGVQQPGAWGTPEWWSSLLDRSGGISSHNNSPLLIPAIQEEEEEEEEEEETGTATSVLQAWMLGLMVHRLASRIGLVGSDGIIPTLENLESTYRQTKKHNNKNASRAQEEGQETQATSSTTTTTTATRRWAAAVGRSMDGVPTVEELQDLLYRGAPPTTTTPGVSTKRRVVLSKF